MKNKKGPAACLAELSEARTKVSTALAGNTNWKCPEGCATQARLAGEAGDYVMAYSWYSAASGYTLGHSRSERYDIEGRKHLQVLLDKYDI